MGEQLHIHPLIVHFPAALFITALGLEVLSLLFKKNYCTKLPCAIIS